MLSFIPILIFFLLTHRIDKCEDNFLTGLELDKYSPWRCKSLMGWKLVVICISFLKKMLELKNSRPKIIFIGKHFIDGSSN
jgi:hypothetical protein